MKKGKKNYIDIEIDGFPRKWRKENLIDVVIDKLTNSIENRVTGEVFNTEVARMPPDHAKLIKKNEWQFNWKKEIGIKTREVYKLCTVSNSDIIQGLISIEDKGDHIFMHLVESAKFNKGKAKVYEGVPGNLVAFACKWSMEKGYEGYVAFDSKTALIEHYKATLGTKQVGGQRMYINESSARVLISKYFKQ